MCATDFFFDEENALDNLFGLSATNGFPNVQQLDGLLSPQQGHVEGLQQQSDSSFMRSTQQLSLSQLLSADSTTSTAHVTDTVSMAGGGANASGTPNYNMNNMRMPHPGAMPNNGSNGVGQQPFMRGMNPNTNPAWTSLMNANANNGSAPNANIMQPMNGQHRLSMGGPVNGAMGGPMHMQGPNMPHGPFVNGLAGSNANNMRHPVPLDLNSSSLPNVSLTPPAQGMHLSQMSAQPQLNNQVIMLE